MRVRVGVRAVAAAVLVGAALLGAPGSAGAAPLPPLPPLPGVHAGQVVLVRVVEHSITLDTTVLAGPDLRAWWIDGCNGRTIDAGSVPRESAVMLNPPDTGDGVRRKWVLVIADVSAVPGLLPDHSPTVDGVAADLPPCVGSS